MKYFYLTLLASKKYGILLTAIFIACNCFAQPIISSVSPLSGLVGTEVTIEGENFGSTTNNNVVYFGAVKATITTASSNSLTVLVPTGATYSPLSVTTGGQTAYSNQSFIPTFITTGSIDANSFGSKIDYSTTYLHKSVCIGDLDGDGKSDIVLSSNSNPGKISVYRNTSASDISFAAKTDYNVNNLPSSIKVADLDCDGKLDVICVNDSSGNLSVLRNTSSVGNISFAAKTDYSTGSNPTNVAIADFNLDGTPDLIVTNRGAGSTVSIFKNLSSPGVITFAAKIDKAVPFPPFGVTVGDFDGDGLKDFAVSAFTASIVSVYRNISSDGEILFGSNTDFGTGADPRTVCSGDIDGDGKVDLIVANRTANTFSIFTNFSTPGVMSFSPKSDYATGDGPLDISLADLDGDSKPDIIATNANVGANQYAGNKIAVIKNMSSEGSLYFEAPLTYTTGRFPISVTAGDLNGDTKPDIVTANSFYSNTVSILRNKVGEVIALCPPVASTFLISDKMGNTYQWQVNTGSGFVNVNNNTFYSGAGTIELDFTNIPSSWYGYQYRCLVDGAAYSSVYMLRFVSTWTGAETGEWENPNNWSCGSLPDGYTDVIINTGGFVQVYSTTAICRSLFMNPQVSVRVNTGGNLTITH